MFSLLGNDSKITEVVVAGQQSKGRGRRDNFWFSPPGGLWLSVVLPDMVCNRNITTLNITCGLSCAKACDAVIRDAGISNIRTYLRWPNDLILKCRKLGGLLIEVRTEGQNKRSIILGIGINVNQKKFPGDLERSATSFLIQLNKRISRKKLTLKILEELDNMISYIKEKQIHKLLQEWKFHSYEIGRDIKIETGRGIEKSGKVLGIGENGELIIVDVNGRTVRIFNGYNLRLSDS